MAGLEIEPATYQSQGGYSTTRPLRQMRPFATSHRALISLLVSGIRALTFETIYALVPNSNMRKVTQGIGSQQQASNRGLNVLL